MIATDALQNGQDQCLRRKATLQQEPKRLDHKYHLLRYKPLGGPL